MLKSMLGWGKPAKSRGDVESKRKREESCVVKDSVISRADIDLIKRLSAALPPENLPDLSTLAAHYNASLRGFDMQRNVYDTRHQEMSEELERIKAEQLTQEEKHKAELKALKDELDQAQTEQQASKKALDSSTSQLQVLQQELATAKKSNTKVESRIQQYQVEIKKQVEKLKEVKLEHASKEAAYEKRQEQFKAQLKESDKKYQHEYKEALTLQKDKDSIELENKSLKESLQSKAAEAAPKEGISYADYQEEGEGVGEGEVLSRDTGGRTHDPDPLPEDENEAEEGMPEAEEGMPSKRHKSKPSSKDEQENRALTLNERKALEAAKGAAAKEASKGRALVWSKDPSSVSAKISHPSSSSAYQLRSNGAVEGSPGKSPSKKRKVSSSESRSPEEGARDGHSKRSGTSPLKKPR